MKYEKLPLSFDQQTDLILRRDLLLEDREDLLQFLQKVNYYRLSGYLYPFRDHDSPYEKYKAGTTFSLVKSRYEFDRQLRLLIMDAIEWIEVGILRTLIVEASARKFGSFGYTSIENYDPKISPLDFHNLMNNILRDERNSKEYFIKHYRSKYTDEKYLPLWIAVELMSFGQLFTFYKNQDLVIKKEISERFNVFPPVLDSWLHTLLFIRNACAHHVRIWNQVLPIKPKIPDQKHNPEWYEPREISNDKMFVVLSIISYLMDKISPEWHWRNRLIELLSAYPDIPLESMGFPNDWEKYQLWMVEL